MYYFINIIYYTIDNLIGDIGGISLYNNLHLLTKIHELQLSHNNLSDESIECLCGLSFPNNHNFIMNISCIIYKILKYII